MCLNSTVCLKQRCLPTSQHEHGTRAGPSAHQKHAQKPLGYSQLFLLFEQKSCFNAAELEHNHVELLVQISTLITAKTSLESCVGGGGARVSCGWHA